MIAEIHITLKNGILDPQGKTVHHALENLGLENIEEVRIGKLIRLDFGSVSKEKALELGDEACKKLLANPVIEDYAIQIQSSEE